eukprot:14241537-Heterocapsa_arctica.AAC.1
MGCCLPPWELTCTIQDGIHACFMFEALGGECTSVIIELATFKGALAHYIANIVGDPSLENILANNMHSPSIYWP